MSYVFNKGKLSVVITNMKYINETFLNENTFIPRIKIKNKF